MKKVFISYSHDSDEHKAMVLALSDRLCKEGLDCTIDQYEESPLDGWPIWMDRQVENADYVLVVCSERYCDIAKRNVPRTDGKGVRFETVLIYQELYDSGSENRKFIPILFEGGKSDHIPKPIKGSTWYGLDEDEGYETLYRRLTGQKEVVKPEIGSEVKLPTAARQASSTVSPTPTKKLINITDPAPHFTGRKDYLDAVSSWYSDAKVKVGCLEGFGGIGKSSIARRWYDDMTANGISPEGIFWWGFYMDSSLDNFLDHLLEFASGGKPEEEIKGSFRKMELALERLSGREVLIVLDGFEEMQKGEEAGENFGCCVHAELRELLRGLCDGDVKGLCLVTTRYPLKDVESWWESGSFTAKKVEGLSDEDAVVLLREFGIKGEDGELKSLAKGFEGHALCVTLVATSLAEYYGGDISKAGEMPYLATDKEAGGKAHRILEWYDKQLSNEERTFLQIFSLFRRAVGSGDLPVFTGAYSFNKPLAGLKDFNLRKLASGLVKRRLLSGAVDDGLDAHPLVRDYFAHTFDDEEKRACHEAIYRHIGKTAPELPETLEEMAPLFAMVRHGCAAGLYDEVVENVYYKKIKRKSDFFLTNKLGAWETDLNLLYDFFPNSDLNRQPLVTNFLALGYLRNEAALALHNIGQPIKAATVYKIAVETAVKCQDWRNTSMANINIADLQCLCGDLKGALESSRMAFDAALRVKAEADKKKTLISSKTSIGWCQFLTRGNEETGRQFREAEALELEIAPASGGLYPLGCIRYIEFLLRSNEVCKTRTSIGWNLDICIGNGWPSEISRCHRILGKIERLAGNYTKASESLDEALTIALKVGMPELEMDALLAKGRLFNDTGDWSKAVIDAKRVLKLVERTTFYLYEPDALNILARAAILEGDNPAARSYAESAKEKAEKMGYALAKEDAEEILGEIEAS